MEAGDSPSASNNFQVRYCFLRILGYHVPFELIILSVYLRAIFVVYVRPKKPNIESEMY